MAFQIQFTNGSLKGRRWPVGAEPLVIGRSHSCAIRPKESDVSGKHLSMVEAGSAIAVTVLSAHRTVVAGEKVLQGSIVAASVGDTVELGNELVFSVIDGDMFSDDTSAIPNLDTGTLGGTGTAAPTAATRAADTELFGATGTLGGTGSLAGATAATRAAETGTLTETAATAATQFADSGIIHAVTRGVGADATTGEISGETSIIDASAIAPISGETTNSSLGETQVLQTQAVSREELDKLKDVFKKKKSRKVATKFALLGLVAAIALGASLWFKLESPETELDEPYDYDTEEILPKLAPSALLESISGSLSLFYPSENAKVAIDESTGTIQVRTLIGRKFNVELVIVAQVFRDHAALNESRMDTFRRYIANSPDLVSISDNMVNLDNKRSIFGVVDDDSEDLASFEGDFFGGEEGLKRGVPCTRVEYSRLRDKISVYGIASIFRYGDLCCVIRREVPEEEQDRAKWLLEVTDDYLVTDGDGVFSSSQWEGAYGAGCADPAVVLARCESAFALDTPLEWVGIEKGLRDVLVEVASGGGTPEIGRRARALLKDLRNRKILYWKKCTAARAPLSEEGSRQERDAAAFWDKSVRDAFQSPNEEWHFLAQRPQWWE